MKNVVVTIITSLALAVAMATVAFGAQVSDAASTMSAMSESLSRSVLQVVQSGDVAGVQTLPSTATGGSDGMLLAAVALAAIVGGLALMRKAITDR